MVLVIKNSIIRDNGIGVHSIGDNEIEISQTHFIENGVAVQQIASGSIVIRGPLGDLVLPPAQNYSESALKELASLVFRAQTSGDDPEKAVADRPLWKEWLAAGANAAALISALLSLGAA